MVILVLLLYSFFFLLYSNEKFDNWQWHNVLMVFKIGFTFYFKNVIACFVLKYDSWRVLDIFREIDLYVFNL